jgi:nucleoid-associated protein YgaU
MANIFKDIIDVLNKPLPGTGKKDKDAKEDKKGAAKPVAGPPAPAKVATKSKDAETAAKDQQKAVDVQAELRRRDIELKRAARKAEAEKRRELLEERRELQEMRRKYETAMAEQAKAHAETEETTYTIVAGDTLWAIAQRFLGNGARWPEIHEANKDKIDNPNMIYPGQTIVIPEDDDE